MIRLRSVALVAAFAGVGAPASPGRAQTACPLPLPPFTNFNLRPGPASLP